MPGDAGRDIGQPSLRIDIVQFGGDDQAADRRGALSATGQARGLKAHAIGTREQP